MSDREMEWHNRLSAMIKKHPKIDTRELIIELCHDYIKGANGCLACPQLESCKQCDEPVVNWVTRVKS